MGAQQCEECRQIKSQNIAYGQYEICQYQGRPMALIEKKLELKPGLQERVNEALTQRTAMVSKHVVRLCHYELCQSEYDLYVGLYYEYMPRTLGEWWEEIRLREEEVGQKQLFSLIYGVESGLQALYQLGIPHGCVNLDTILYRGGVFKITDVSSTTNLTSYELVLQGNRNQFLSERLLNNLSYKIMKPTEFTIHDDLLSLALIVLMIVTKSTPQHFYQWKSTERLFTGTLNVKFIESAQRVLARNYSSKLVRKVRSFLMGKSEEQQELEESALTAELQELSEEMNRVMERAKGSVMNSMVNSVRASPGRY